MWVTNPLTQAEAKVTVKDMTPIVRLVLEPALIVVKADAPYKTLRDFIDAAKKTPGQLKQSGGSITSRDNVIRQLMMKNTGANWAFISFPGGGERIVESRLRQPSALDQQRQQPDQALRWTMVKFVHGCIVHA